MSRASALALSGVLCFLPLTACSDNEPASTPSLPTTSSSSVMPATESPTSDPASEGGEPALPELAKQHSLAGAHAFIEHYVSVLSSAYGQTKPRLLRRYTPEGCNLCISFLHVLNRVDRLGGSQLGGAWTPIRVDLASREASGSWIFITDVDIAKGRAKGSSDAPPQEIPADKIRLDIRLLWSRDRWTLTDVQPL